MSRAILLVVGIALLNSDRFPKNSSDCLRGSMVGMTVVRKGLRYFWDLMITRGTNDSEEMNISYNRNAVSAFETVRLTTFQVNL
jgi:hypothetical protein